MEPIIHGDMQIGKQKASMDKPAYFQVASGIWGMKTIFVNLYMVASKADPKKWILIDTGFKGFADKIVAMAHDIFGRGSKPEYILLTHGHLDHVGNLKDLIERWEVPVYAHKLEMPYITGRSSYPPPDPTVGKGIMSLMSVVFSPKPININSTAHALNDDGTIPLLPEWQYIPTPGHSPGHISFWREADKVLIVGDAFVTTQQESAYSVMTQQKRLCGPPRYFTMDWREAHQSVTKLAQLDPYIAAAGHGLPMRGDELYKALQHLEDNFEDVAVPKYGRYTKDAARADASGVYFVPPLNLKYIGLVTLTVAVGTTAVVLLAKLASKAVRRKQHRWA